MRAASPASDERWPPLPEGWWRGTAPQATFPVPFTVWDGALVAGWSLLGQVVIGLPLGFLLTALGVDITSGAAMVGFAAAVVVLVFATALLYLRLRGVLSWRVGGPVRPGWSDLLWGVLVGVAGVIVIQLGAGVILQLLGETDPPEQTIVQSLTEGGATTVVVVVLAVVVAPIVEEVAFRGVWFQSLRRVVGLWPAAVISGLTFGMVHVEVAEIEALPAVVAAGLLVCGALVPQLPSPVRAGLGALGLAALAFAVSLGGFASIVLPGALATLGVVFALIFHRTGSLLVPIIGHAVFNGIVVSLALVVDRLELV